ncbi:MAG: type II toxin-antitoxin system RelE/ParE family toxin [Kiritimatiellae bacterium]|nr:type II toxin-antitoxin system RelE/ParE family toxin [Kiritimatiellia bacterium]
MRVEVLDPAHEDMLEATWFYGCQDQGLGAYFSDTLYGEIESLGIYAGIHPRRHGFYMMVSRVFPYSIYYDIVDDVALVYAVLDNRRNPDWINERLDQTR